MRTFCFSFVLIEQLPGVVDAYRQRDALFEGDADASDALACNDFDHERDTPAAGIEQVGSRSLHTDAVGSGRHICEGKCAGFAGYRVEIPSLWVRRTGGGEVCCDMSAIYGLPFRVDDNAGNGRGLRTDIRGEE